MRQIDGKRRLGLVPRRWPSGIGSATFVLTTRQTAELEVGTGLVTLTVTAPSAFADSYQLDPSQLATGPVVLAPPVLEGAVQVGQTLEVRPALWALAAGGSAPQRSWQWQRNGVDLAGETGETFTPSAGDSGTEVRVVERVSDAAGARLSSSPTVTVP